MNLGDAIAYAESVSICLGTSIGTTTKKCFQDGLCDFLTASACNLRVHIYFEIDAAGAQSATVYVSRMGQRHAVVHEAL